MFLALIKCSYVPTKRTIHGLYRVTDTSFRFENYLNELLPRHSTIYIQELFKQAKGENKP